MCSCGSFFRLCAFRRFLAILCRDDDLRPIDLGPNLCAVRGSLGDFLHGLSVRLGLFQRVLDGIGHICRDFRFRRFRCPALALALFRPDFRQYARLEADLEGDSPGQRYVEVKRLIGQFLDLVRDFDVLVALDLFAVHYEANRHRVPEFRCELSAFHDLCLPLFCVPRG